MQGIWYHFSAIFSEGNPLEPTGEQQVLFAKWSSLADRKTRSPN